MPDLNRNYVGIVEEIVEPRDRVLQREVSVVIPAFDEAAHVASQIRDVRDVMEISGWRYEIIGSTTAPQTGPASRPHRRTRVRRYFDIGGTADTVPH